MRNPRGSIARHLGWLVLVVLNCAVVEELYRATDNKLSLVLLGLLPVVIVLVIGLSNLLPDPSAQVAGRSFWVGFEVFGWLAVILFSAVCWWRIGRVASYIDVSVAPMRTLFRRWGYDSPRARAPFLEAVVAMLALALPQLSFAVIGGLMNRMARAEVEPRRPPTQHR
jgi:hypothetical protein